MIDEIKNSGIQKLNARCGSLAKVMGFLLQDWVLIVL